MQRTRRGQAARWLGGGLLAASLLLTTVACTPETHVTVAAAEQSGITVSGTGKVTVVPDLAVLNLGVLVQRPTVVAARDDAAKAMDNVRTALRGTGIEEQDIATQGFSIQPQYDYSPSRGGAPTITGYIVTNQIAVKVRKLENVSNALDTAVRAGGNDIRVSNVQFTVDDPAKHRDRARTAAVEDARRHAEQLAQAAGVELGSARFVSETSGPAPYPVPAVANARGAAQADVATPVSPGETQISLVVNVVYNIR